MPEVTNLEVKAVRKDKGGFKLSNEKWYSPDKKGIKYNHISRGDFVSFEYTENGDWNNINTPVETVSGGAIGVGSKPTIEVGFPVPALHYSRSIIRQNCLAHATKVVLARVAHSKTMPTMERFTNDIINAARRLEAFASGDLDAAEAKRIMEATGTEEEAA